MTTMKMLSAAAFLAAAIATPVFAQDTNLSGPADRYRSEPQPLPDYGRSCFQGPGFGQPCAGRLYGWSTGRDRSRAGRIDPSLRPSGS